MNPKSEPQYAYKLYAYIKKQVCQQLARSAENFVLFILKMSYIEEKWQENREK